ncbi:MAG: putative replicative helicase, partial [Gammaproteobacteria bacterium]|nr:putative replicative helicase [Gammaproteobacteria bacterium]
MKVSDEETEAAPSSSDLTPPKLPFIWSWDLLENRLPASKMVLSPWLPERGLALIYGQRGCGKTRLAVAIAYAIATGDSLLG